MPTPNPPPSSPPPSPPRGRLVFLGASNLARDFPRVLAVSRNVLGPAAGGPTHPTEDVFVAAGHGRSYGRWSRVLVRGLPGIVECGLWEALESCRPTTAGPPATRALLTDVGNDLLYGASASEIAGWLGVCLARLDALGARSVLTLLPLESLRRLGPLRFQILRTLLYPARFHRFGELLARAEELQERLQDLAVRHAVPTVEPDPSWFGPDRIHLRPGARDEAWRRQLEPWASRPRLGSGGDGEWPRHPLTRPAWWAMTPERWTLLGRELGREQPAGRLEDGGRVWVY